jgi:hypothetical protein
MDISFKIVTNPPVPGNTEKWGHRKMGSDLES